VNSLLCIDIPDGLYSGKKVAGKIIIPPDMEIREIAWLVNARK